MPVRDVVVDADASTLTLTAEYPDAAPHQVWQVWVDPRLLERWWGPPGYPATFVEHELTVGSRATYFMTGPDGERFHGCWQVNVVDPGRGVHFQDAFCDAEWNRDPSLPATEAEVTLTNSDDGGTRMTIFTQFVSPAALQQSLDMGMEDGMSAAVGQIDALLVGPVGR